MNSSFPNRWSFSYLNFTKYVTNMIIGEPKFKYGQQEQVTVRKHNRSIALERSVLKYWGLKPFLRVPNFALGFCHGSKHTAVRSAWRNFVYAICKQQRCRSACAFAQSDQRLCCRCLDIISGFYTQNFKPLACLYS